VGRAIEGLIHDPSMVKSVGLVGRRGRWYELPPLRTSHTTLTALYRSAIRPYSMFDWGIQPFYTLGYSE
jgi:hypothetical protein